MIQEGQSSYSKAFRYRMWVSDTATEVDENGVWKYSDMTFTVKVNVYASNEEIGMPIVENPDPNSPVLVQGQIPVVYDEVKSSWVKADTSSEWYNYNSQEWANAVTVTEASRESYMNASAGTPISMEDINTMWVWIPRYEYMYTNLGNQYAGGTQKQPGEIKINFLSGVSTTPSDATNYKVHPAFTFGEDELEGIWFAKFETTGTLSGACTNTSCNASTITIKPGLLSLADQKVSSVFYMARSMQMNDASTYGFSTTDSDLHMIKNRDWGAVAYMSQSKYGKYGNSNYVGIEKEIRMNNCESFITGVGADNMNAVSSSTTCTTNTYETANGMASSTTGNITGVYDMNGGAYEYTMGVLADNNGEPRSGFDASSNSGFNGSLNSGRKTDGVDFPDAKYYDLYTSIDIMSACNGEVCFGHALSETENWYGDKIEFPTTVWNKVYPWVRRGGSSFRAESAGTFTVKESGGSANSMNHSRLVIVPNA